MTKKVIIIDDSSLQLHLLKIVFSDKQWDVHCATDAQSAWEMIFDIAPDLIITDAIMPSIGGFQFIQNISNNSKISKIPVIIYSVISENAAKFFIKNSKQHYFYRKNQEAKRLVDLAIKAIEENPIDENYKNRILKTPKQERENLIAQKDTGIDNSKSLKENLLINFKEKIDLHADDSKNMRIFFEILHIFFDYDLSLIKLYSYENQQDTLYFDIRNIILSPIAQNQFLEDLNCDAFELFKKYIPNMRTVSNKDEFLSEVELNFLYLGTEIAKIRFCSLKTVELENNEAIQEFKEAAAELFKLRFLIKNKNKKQELTNSYAHSSHDLISLNNYNHKERENYAILINILNYEELQEHHSEDELDIINSKFARKLMENVQENEQIKKISKEQYQMILFAKDTEEINKRLDLIIQDNQSIQNDEKFDIKIYSLNIKKENSFEIAKTFEILKKAIEDNEPTEEMIIKNG